MDFNSLSQQEKVDYILLKNSVAKGDYFLNQDFEKFKEVSDVANFAKPMLPFIQQRRRGKKPDAKMLAQRMQNASKILDEQMAARKEKPFKDWQTADKASSTVLSFQKGLKNAYEFYSEGELFAEQYKG